MSHAGLSRRKKIALRRLGFDVSGDPQRPLPIPSEDVLILDEEYEDELLYLEDCV